MLDAVDVLCAVTRETLMSHGSVCHLLAGLEQKGEQKAWINDRSPSLERGIGQGHMPAHTSKAKSRCPRLERILFRVLEEWIPSATPMPRSPVCHSQIGQIERHGKTER